MGQSQCDYDYMCGRNGDERNDAIEEEEEEEDGREERRQVGNYM